MSLESITSAALALPPDSRAALAETLLLSLDPRPEMNYRAEWEAEIEDRIDALERGEVELVSREEVMRRLGKAQ